MIKSTKMDSKTNKIPRFAFRKEYFGGLLLDFQNTIYELLTSQEFRFLEKLIAGNKFFLQDLKDSKLKEFIEKLRQKNIIKVDPRGELLIDDIRKIPPPEEIPNEYLSAPLKAYDTYTRKCNLACRHCYASANPNLIEKRRTISQTKTIMKKFYEVGVLEWNFTGGEPTIITDLLKAIKIAVSFGMKVSLNTNGCWNSKISNIILESGVKEFIISLDGREKTHDNKRDSGTFKRVIKTLDQIYKYNQNNFNNKLKVILNMTIGKDNIRDIEYVTYLGVKYGYDVKFVPLKPAGRAFKSFILSTRDYKEFAKKVQQLRENPKIKDSGINIFLNHKDLFNSQYPDRSNLPYPFNYSQCTALTTAMDILPDGRVVACSFLMDKPEFIGPNILDVSLYDAWRHPKMERFRRAQRQGCINCKFYMKRCRGVCRATVLLSGGKIQGKKLTGNDPYCFKDLLS